MCLISKMENREEKPLCEFGAKCYRKNPHHLEKYSHPDKTKDNALAVNVKDSIENGNVNIKISPKTKMKQTTLSFPKKCDFSSAPQAQNVKKKKSPLTFKKESGMVKDDCVESAAVKRRRKNSHSEKNKGKMKIPNSRNKTSSCFKSHDSSSEVVAGSSDNSTYDCGAVQSDSWIFIKNQSDAESSLSEITELKNKSTEEVIKTLFLVNMPSDFYSFYDFCKSLNDSHPLKALESVDLKLVGPFDAFSEKLNYSIDKESVLCHWRFYYDPPEFQTVLATDSGFHIGYWRDDPTEYPVFLASNNSDKDHIFKVEAENIFGTVFNYLNEFIKNCDPFKKLKVKKLKDSLSSWVKKTQFTLEKKTAKMIERQKKVVTKSFHRVGLVVPVQPKTEVGYRPLIESEANLKKICGLIMKANSESERDSLWENLQPLITAANIANDECDFGNSLELGINLFCMGSPVFHDTIKYLLSTAYSLLNRTEFEKIIKAHLKFRRKGYNLSVFSD